MKNNYALKYALPLFCCFILMITLAIPFTPSYGEERVYSDTIRLHVLANSDSEEDQQLKLKVRDGVLDYLSGHLDSSLSKEENKAFIEENIAMIESLSEKIIRDNGYDHNVCVSLDEEYYPTCEYEGVRMPEGRYTSLRVMIGSAEGHNWWCILYPTLCTSAAKPENELRAAGFTKEEIRVLTDSENPKYRVRFKILEFASSLYEKIAG